MISDGTDAVVATMTVGATPYGLAYDSAKGEVFVANINSRAVSVISDSTNGVVAAVTTPGFPGVLHTTPVRARCSWRTWPATPFR